MHKRRIVVFDFDGTITKKDTFLEFIKFSKGYIHFTLGFLCYAPLLILFKLKLYPNWKAKQKLFSFYFKNETIEQFNRWGATFAEKVDMMLNPKIMEEIKKYHSGDDTSVLIISASVENWIKPWASRHGIDLVLATKIETDKNNKLTGKFSTKNCYGQEKVNRLLELYPDRESYELISYGDSQGDEALLRFSDKGTNVSFEKIQFVDD